MKNNKNIEFGALRVFATVAESDTLTQAAQRLGITQSGVSQVIKQLEQQTGTMLVARRSRPIKLTPNGLVLNKYAQKILEDTHQMLADVKSASHNGMFELRLGMIDSFGDIAALDIVKRIKPYVSKFSLQTGLNVRLNQSLLERDLDMLITSDPMDEYPEFAKIPIFRDPFMIVAPEKYFINNEENVEKMAQDLPFIHYSREHRIGKMTDLVARRMGVQLQTQFELDSTQTLLSFVQAGYGWSIVSGLCVVRYPELLIGTRVMSISKGANARHLCLLYRTNEYSELSENVALICRNISSSKIVPALTNIAPWLEQQAYAIEELPII